MRLTFLCPRLHDQKEYNLPDVKDRQYLITMHKKAKKKGFDVDQYNNLRRQVAEVEYDLQRLRDPLYLRVSPTIYGTSSVSKLASSSSLASSFARSSQFSPNLPASKKSSLLSSASEIIVSAAKKFKK